MVPTISGVATAVVTQQQQHELQVGVAALRYATPSSNWLALRVSSMATSLPGPRTAPIVGQSWGLAPPSALHRCALHEGFPVKGTHAEHDHGDAAEEDRE